MRYVSYLFGGLSLAAAAVYLVIYLYRWEWQRAIVAGVLLLAVEGFLVLVVMLGRLGRIERRLAEADSRVDEIKRRLEHTREEPAGNAFRWLGDLRGDGPGGTSRTFVFVPVLMVTGAALSGIAWVVQRFAALTARPGAERRLAGRLAPLAAPAGGVRGPLPQLEDRPAVPRPRVLRTLAAVVASVAAVALLVLGVKALSDATETRAEARPDAAASIVVFRIEVHGTSSDPARQLAAQDLWESCRRSTSTDNPGASLDRLSTGIYAAVVRPALSSHDMMRLRGCLSDATANRATATILGDGAAVRDH
jgi:hypothetical protein